VNKYTITHRTESGELKTVRTVASSLKEALETAGISWACVTELTSVGRVPGAEYFAGRKEEL